MEYLFEILLAFSCTTGIAIALVLVTFIVGVVLDHFENIFEKSLDWPKKCFIVFLGLLTGLASISPMYLFA